MSLMIFYEHWLIVSNALSPDSVHLNALVSASPDQAHIDIVTQQIHFIMYSLLR